MADTTDHEAEFDEAFKGFGEEPQQPATPAPPDPDDGKPPAPEQKEEPKKDEPANPEEPVKKPEDTDTDTPDEKKPEDPAEPPKDPEKPEPAEEPATPLTKDDLTSVIDKVRLEERNSVREVENTTNEVLEAYYPDGLSNVLVDQASGKELRTPQDVVDASGGEMTTEQAAQWLMNEQYKLDRQVAEIKDNARQIAETTVNFKRDSIAALQKYAPLFEKYPHLQQKVFDKLKKQVKADVEKGVILSAPDVMEHYDDYLEPYQLAFEHSTQQSATNPVAPAEEPKTPTPGTDDRLDEGGDGGSTAPNDPNDFAQQVNKELAKGL